MISHIHTCKHCQSEYIYYTTGCQIDSNLNNKDFCPDCMVIVNQALSKVKKKFERRTVDASEEVTLDELLEAEKQNKKEAEARSAKGELVMRRLSVGLFDMGRGDNNNCRYIKYKGVEYHLNEWDHNPEYYISKEVRWDLMKDLCVDGKYYSSPQELINTDKAKVYKKWLDKTPVKEQNWTITLTEPVGLKYALRFAKATKELDDAGSFDILETLKFEQNTPIEASKFDQKKLLDGWKKVTTRKLSKKELVKKWSGVLDKATKPQSESDASILAELFNNQEKLNGR